MKLVERLARQYERKRELFSSVNCRQFCIDRLYCSELNVIRAERPCVVRACVCDGLLYAAIDLLWCNICI